MIEAISTADSCGIQGNRIGVAVPATLLIDSHEETVEWWREVRRGFIQAVSVDQKSMESGAQLFGCLWQAGVKTGFVSLEELSSLVCWQPAKMFGLNQKGRLYPGSDADIAIIDPEICSNNSGSIGQEIDCQLLSSGNVTNLLRGGVPAVSKSGRWVTGTPVREPI
jgi:alpha-D-ribose 1-methylphosphonate 5-triphosphate diphosphatase PhnM